MSFFETIGMVPDDPSTSIPCAFEVDPRKTKVNLATGDYVDSNGRAVTLSCAKKAEQMIAEKGVCHESLPLEGDSTLIKETLKLILGETTPLIDSEEVFAIQTLGGTHALCVGAEFVNQQFDAPVFVSTPSWQHHRSIFKQAGLSVNQYSYYDPIHHRLDFLAFCKSIQQMETLESKFPEYDWKNAEIVKEEGGNAQIKVYEKLIK